MQNQFLRSPLPLTAYAIASIRYALLCARSKGNTNVDPSDILSGIFFYDSFVANVASGFILRSKAEIKAEFIRQKTHQDLDVSFSGSITPTDVLSVMSADSVTAINYAMQYSLDLGNNHLGTEHILYGIIKLDHEAPPSMRLFPSCDPGEMTIFINRLTRIDDDE